MVVSSLLKYEFLTSLLAVLREEWIWEKFRRQKNKKGTDAFLLFLWLKNYEYYTQCFVCEYSGSFGGKQK